MKETKAKYNEALLQNLNGITDVAKRIKDNDLAFVFAVLSARYLRKAVSVSKVKGRLDMKLRDASMYAVNQIMTGCTDNAKSTVNRMMTDYVELLTNTTFKTLLGRCLTEYDDVPAVREYASVAKLCALAALADGVKLRAASLMQWTECLYACAAAYATKFDCDIEQPDVKRWLCYMCNVIIKARQ